MRLVRSIPCSMHLLVLPVLLGLSLVLASPAQGGGEDPPAKAAEKETRGQSGKDSDKKAEPLVSPFVKAVGGGKGPSGSKVYTNDDLKSIAGGVADEPSETEAPEATPAEPAASAEGEAGAPAKSPLEQLQEQEKARAEHREKIAQAEKTVAEAEARVQDLEKRALASRNPLLPRPAPPEDEEARKSWESAGAAQRADIADQQLQAAREALEKARRDLDQLRSSMP